MLRILILCAALAGLGGAAAAQGKAPAEVIREQLDAFLADDVETAFAYASPAIRRLFGTARTFGTMVREAYPMVWRPGRVAFLEARSEGEVLYQNVLIVDGNGVPHVLDYMMVEAGGGWRINGVRILAAPPVGA